MMRGWSGCLRRLLSTVAESADATAVKPPKYKTPNFYEIADKLEHGGKGSQLTRNLWNRYPEPSFWTVSRVKFSKHGHTPKAWGILTFRGVTESKPREIRCTHKRQWRLFKSDMAPSADKTNDQKQQMKSGN